MLKTDENDTARQAACASIMLGWMCNMAARVKLHQLA